MNLFLIHAGLMAAGFLSFLSALLIAATQRRKRWWLKVHRIAGLGGTTLMLLGAVTAVAAVASFAGVHLRTPHTWLGALTVTTALITPVLGLLQFSFPAQGAMIRTVHRFCGRFLNLIAPVTIVMGLRSAGIL